MIYKAVVLDNSMLFTRGTIRVRIAGMYNKRIIWDLQERFPETLEEGNIEDVNTQFSKDYEAQLIAPFGGGRNYGALSVPQINEKGLVAFLNGSKSKPIWMGGLFETRRDENFNVEFVNFPTDRFIDGENADGVLNGEGNIGDDIEPQEEKSIILRTKHTNSNSVEEIDFEQQETSNIITIGKRRIRVTHFPEGSWEDGIPKKYKDFLIGLTEDGEDVIRLKSRDDENDNHVEFELKEEHGIISLVKEGVEQARFSIEEGNITLFNKEGENRLIFSDSGDIEISNKEGNNKILFGDNDEIEISNDSGSKIIMKSNGNIELLADNEVHILGNDDHLVRYSELKEIIEEFEGHVHIAPSGPTSPALNGSQAPIASSTLKLSMDMKSQKGKLN